MRRPKRHQSKLQQRCRELSSRCDVYVILNRGLCKQLNEVHDRCDSLAEEKAKSDRKVAMANKIIDRAATIDFERCENGYYQISVTFNGDFMGGISRYGEVQRHVARRVAEQIEHEIASSKFVETARQNYRQQMERGSVFRAGEKGWMENPYGQ